MESVKRYDCTNGKARHCYGCYEMTELPNGEYVSGDDFDRVSAENLALQQRLTVQDRRVDELENALKNMIAAFDTPIRRRKLSSDFNDQAIASAWSALNPTAEAVSHAVYRQVLSDSAKKIIDEDIEKNGVPK
jgi:hypothetical protein